LPRLVELVFLAAPPVEEAAVAAAFFGAEAAFLVEVVFLVEPLPFFFAGAALCALQQNAPNATMQAHPRILRMFLIPLWR
jgi:hypothetical protein